VILPPLVFPVSMNLRDGLLHLTGQPNSQKRRTTKVKDGIISETKFLATISVERFSDKEKKVL
jgi:hypothetical protein